MTASHPASGDQPGGGASPLASAGGSARHAWLRDPALVQGPQASRNAADFVHHLVIAHGRYPGLAETALLHTRHPEARALIAQIADGFAIERAFLAQLVVAAGPMPSTPGHAACEVAMAGHAHAITLLARSDREGCALGAAVALAEDCMGIRSAIDLVAARLSIPVPEYALPDPEAIGEAVRLLALPDASARAMQFGADQLRAQHDGLWSLLAARAAGRAELD